MLSCARIIFAISLRGMPTMRQIMKKQNVNSMDSTPCSNVINSYYESLSILQKVTNKFAKDNLIDEQIKFSFSCMDARKLNNVPNSLELCKLKLGKQNYTFTTYRRYHVWHDETNESRIFVNKDYGIGIEVDPEKIKTFKDVERIINYWDRKLNQ